MYLGCKRKLGIEMWYLTADLVELELYLDGCALPVDLTREKLGHLSLNEHKSSENIAFWHEMAQNVWYIMPVAQWLQNGSKIDSKRPAPPEASVQHKRIMTGTDD